MSNKSLAEQRLSVVLKIEAFTLMIGLPVLVFVLRFPG